MRVPIQLSHLSPSSLKDLIKDTFLHMSNTHQRALFYFNGLRNVQGQLGCVLQSFVHALQSQVLDAF